MPFYPRLDENAVTPDFRELLRQTSSGERRLFAPLAAGQFVLSVQASAHHASFPSDAQTAFDIHEWEVAIFNRYGRWLTPTNAPEIFCDDLWADCWSGEPATGRYVPTEVVQVLYDMLYTGPEEYYPEIAAFEQFLSGDQPSSLALF